MPTCFFQLASVGLCSLSQRTRHCPVAIAPEQPPGARQFDTELTRGRNTLSLVDGPRANCGQGTRAARACAGVEARVVGGNGAGRRDASDEALAGLQPAVARRHCHIGRSGHARGARVARRGDRHAARATAPAADAAARARGRACVPRKARGAPGRQKQGTGASVWLWGLFPGECPCRVAHSSLPPPGSCAASMAAHADSIQAQEVLMQAH